MTIEFLVPEIDIELIGYENDSKAFAADRAKELKTRVSEYLRKFGIPQIGMSFYDGNLAANLSSVLYARHKKGPVIYFTFYLP